LTLKKKELRTKKSKAVINYFTEVTDLPIDVFLCTRKAKILKSKRLLGLFYLQFQNYLYKQARRVTRIYQLMEVDELVNEGYEGLLKALEKYDHREASFLTYAQHWVRMKMYNYAHKSITAILLPSGFHSLLNKVKEFMDENPDASKEDIQDTFGINSGRLDLVMRVMLLYKTISHSATDPCGFDTCYCDSLCEDKSTSVIDEVHDRVYKDNIWGKIEEVLTEKEVFVLKSLYGHEDNVQKSLERVSKVLKVSKERIRQIKKQAIEKLLLSNILEELKNGY